MRLTLVSSLICTVLYISSNFCGSVDANSNDESVKEHLLIHPLPTLAHVLTHLQLTTSISAASIASGHYSNFPRSIAHLISEYEIYDLHLSFTQSRWNSDEWGMTNTAWIAPIGVQMHVWAEGLDADKWKKLTNVLSGFFCASLNFMKIELTADDIPKSLSPDGERNYMNANKEAKSKVEGNVCQ